MGQRLAAPTVHVGHWEADLSLFGFSLVLAAALCHAAWNFYLKRINGGPELVWLVSVLVAILYLPFAIWLLAAGKMTFGFWQAVFIMGTGTLHLAYFLLLQAGYRVGDLSLVYPVARATGPMLSTAFAVVILKENVTTQMALGALAIVGGVLCLTGGFSRGVKNALPSLAFGLATGFFIGCYTVWDAYAVSVILIPPLLLDYFSTLLRCIVLSPVAWSRRETVAAQWRDHRMAVVVIAAVSPLAYILVLHAMTFTPVAYVAPAREMSVVFTVLAGSILLGEGDLRRRLFWACVILAGVVLLAAG